MSRWANPFLYFSVFLSGVSALIYEVIWHRYLATLLGAQHKATAIVLGIFLGGMSLGYHFFGLLSKRLRFHPLKCLGIVEIGLGIWAFLFPYIFKFCFDHIGRVYGVLGVNSLWVDLLFSLILIGLPTLLMGGTLPLIAQGATSNYSKAGVFHARVYGFNTLGACLGCLFATYILLTQLNFPLALMLGGVLNIGVGLFCYEFLSKQFKWNHSDFGAEKASLKPVTQTVNRITLKEAIIFGIAGISGFGLLTLQAALIRLIGLSAGSSNFNFGLVVGIFIFCLGVGSLLTSALSKPTTKHLVLSLFFSSLFLCVFCFVIADLPYKHHLLRLVFRTSHENFYVYQLVFALAFFTILVFPLGFGGAVLPLCFQFLKQGSKNLGARVGQLYAINTLGCLLGGGFGGYFLYQYFDLEGIFRLCIYLCIFSTFLSLLLISSAHFSLVKRSVLIVSLMGIIFVTQQKFRFDRALFAQAFRIQFPFSDSYSGSAAFAKRIFASSKYVHYKDGPDGSVGIAAHYKDGKEISRTLFMNGKSDGNTQGDWVTMQLTGLLPALFAKNIESSCVIGFGTGITIGALAQFPEMRVIDVAEISETLLAEIKLFDSYNGRVSENKSVKSHAMDAFRFLEGTEKKYDLIVSEPSTPWLTGVENLYSKEFYNLVSRRLGADGVFAQWVQAYSFNEELFRMVMKTITHSFRSVRVFQMRPYDLLILASAAPLDGGSISLAEARIRSHPKVGVLLNELGFHGMESLLALEAIPPSLARSISQYSQVHSVFAPRLSSGAARAFFAGENLELNKMIREDYHFFRNFEESLFSIYRKKISEPRQMFANLFQSYCSYPTTDFSDRCRQLGIFGLWNNLSEIKSVKQSFKLSDADLDAIEWLGRPQFKFDEPGIVKLRNLTKIYQQNFSSFLPIDATKLISRIELCLKRTDFKSTGYGECLLEKIKLTEMTGGSKKGILSLFKNWVENLPANFPDFEKYAFLKNHFELLSVDDDG